MTMLDIEKVGLIAQNISFAFEDSFYDKEKLKLFDAIFDRFLSQVDVDGKIDIYDAVIALWRRNPAEFTQMIQEMKDRQLIQD